MEPPQLLLVLLWRVDHVPPPPYLMTLPSKTYMKPMNLTSNAMRVRATAEVEAVAPKGGEGLIEFLKAYRDAVQEIANEL